MNQEFQLRIADIPISVKADASYKINCGHPFYKDFFSQGRPKVNLRVHCGIIPQYHGEHLLFDVKEEGYWRLYQNNSKYIIEFFDTETFKKDKVCFLEQDFHSADIFIDGQLERFYCQQRGNSRFRAFISIMQPLARIIFANILPRYHGIMVHGLGIRYAGEGIAFLGRGGSGKSTLAGFYKKEKKAEILSDEHIIIRKKNNKFFLYGTPWPGEGSRTCAQKAELKRLFFIEHGEKNEILGQAGLERFFPLLFLSFWDKARVKASLSLCKEILHSLECKKLGFVNNPSVINFLKNMN